MITSNVRFPTEYLRDPYLPIFQRSEQRVKKDTDCWASSDEASAGIGGRESGSGGAVAVKRGAKVVGMLLMVAEG